MNDDPNIDADVAQWTDRARGGCQLAFAQLHRRFLPLVHGILLGRFRPALADELSQECFAKAFARLAQLRDGHRFGAWIAAMARRMRPTRIGVEVAADDHAALASTDASPEVSAEATQLLGAVAALPEAYRETLMLRLVEGLSGPEIAALTGHTPDSVRVNLHRGMARLRRSLGLVETGARREETT